MIKFFTLLLFVFPSLFSQVIILHCGVLIDGSEKPTSRVVSILIDKDRIVDISEGYTNPGPNDVLIDLNGYTVLPGLMDMHTHLSVESSKNIYLERYTKNLDDYAYQSINYAEKTLYAGFTTVRDLGGPINNSLRDAIKKGLLPGPRIFSAGQAIATTGGRAYPTKEMEYELMGDLGPSFGVINGTIEASKAVRYQYKRGSDLIKITATGNVLSLGKSGQNPQFSEEEIRAIVETAADYNMHVAAYANGPEGIKRAVRAGVRSIEHGALMDQESISLMKDYGTYYVPTLSAGEFVSEKAKETGYYPELVRKKAKLFGPKIKETFKKALGGNLKIVFGTNSGVSVHGENAKEFVYMVEGGMKPLDAIKSATINAAKLLEIEADLGSIEVGKIADIIAIKGNPIEDISLLQKTFFVMKNGKVYKNITR